MILLNSFLLSQAYCNSRNHKSHKENFGTQLQFRTKFLTENHNKMNPALLSTLKEVQMLRNKSTLNNVPDCKDAFPCPCYP